MSIEWDGKGLPPVGMECELTPHNSRWGFSGSSTYRGAVIAYNGEDFWFKDSSNVNTVSRTDKVDFRPIITEAERKREEAAEAIKSIIIDFDLAITEHRGAEINIAIDIVSAIAAGKIPGIRLTDD